MALIHIDDRTVFCSISTFSGGGIGDAGIEFGAKVPVISACELVPDRAGLIRHNYPSTEVFQGDIWEQKEKIIAHSKKKLGGKNPWLFVMSPPCQGMSANGAGKISSSIAAGKRPKEDERNRLVLPGIEIIEELQPSWFLLENVRRMENTVITNELGDAENILDTLGRRLHPLGYTIRSAVIDFRDIGVPHHRERLITIGTRIPALVEAVPPGTIFSPTPTLLHPELTHGKERKTPHITLRDVIGKMPPLEAVEGKSVDPKDPFHHVPVWNEKHHFWLSHTNEGDTAFHNNRCVNKNCQAESTVATETNCSKCGDPLPRPQTTVIGWECRTCKAVNKATELICACGKKRRKDAKMSQHYRLIRGFKTSYRRLSWDKPASTLTMNSGVISSDMKGHPEQNRVLSVREILMLSSLDNFGKNKFPWAKEYKFLSKKSDGTHFYDGEFTPRLVRQVIGESIPPLAMQIIVEKMIDLDPRNQVNN